MERIKKGMFFTLDALFATILIGIALVISAKFFIADIQQPQIEYYSRDIVDSLSSIKITEVNDSYIQTLIASGEITNLNNSVIEQIGEFYVLNKTSLAEELSEIISRKLIPAKFGFEILVNNESVYLNSSISDGKSNLISSRRMISGIEKFKPLRGATSKVFLESIRRKKYSSYIYFGGFVGQGNISVFSEDIPEDVNLTGAYMEVDSGSDFELYINTLQCLGTFAVSAGTMTADGWDISSCNNSIVPGAKNNFSVTFTGDMGSAYFGGGYIKVDYLINTLQQLSQEDTMTEWMPGITGIINLYSSFYIPGNLNNISIYLHYYANTTNQTNNTFYFTMGNATIFKDTNLSGEKNHTVTLQNITQYLQLSSLSEKTVPIRAGFENVSFGYIYEGMADLVLITDLSGSMDWRMSDNNGGTARNCDDASFNDSTTARLSVAKCLDKQFATDVLNITGNKIGLVSFATTTRTTETIYPTNSYNLLNSTIGIAVPQTGYAASGSTCVCCGINTARQILMANITAITLVSLKSSWRYNNFSLHSEPPQDNGGNYWYSVSYANESQWFTANATLGSTNGYSYNPVVNKEIGSDLSGSLLYPNLWESAGDNPGTPADFTSGSLNTSGSDYGIGGADDGWDKDPRDGTGPFGFDDDVDYNNVVSGRITLDNNYGGSGNTCTNRDCSGAYGILINITQQMFDTVSSQGTALISFSYEWDDVSGNNFESADEIWIKARWTSPTSGQHYLGSSLDIGHAGADADFEMDAEDNPNIDMSDTYSQDISAWIEGPGTYYLEAGGKLNASSADETGTWRFDNIQLRISNATDYYYFRKNFTISNINWVKKGVLNILSDDSATIYLNGEIIDSDFSEHDARYWNRIGKNIPASSFVQGNNVIAAVLKNSKDAAKFDLELIGINDSRDNTMMVMTDGQANEECAAQGVTGDMDGDGSSDTASDDAVQAACDARQDYGITVYAVGYSDEADEPTLNGIALCGDGISTKSNNITVLQEFYKDVASTIISASRHSQTIDITGQGSIAASILYGDSYIKADFTPVTIPPQFGEISMVVEEKNFNNCSFIVAIPSDVRVSDARLTSYSSEHWTDNLIVNNNEVYNLSLYSQDYTSLGDPFIVNIPVSVLLPGNNTFFIRTGDSPENNTECSMNNTLIYTAQIKASVSYSDVLEKAIGCSWFVEFDDGGNASINVPQDYSGPKTCSYTHLDISYDIDDTYDDAMYHLLDNLDFDNDGRIYVDIQENNLIIGAISVGKIPYPWGPALAEIRVWR